MKVVNRCSAVAPDIGAVVQNHKVHLGSKYAFLFNKEVIGKAKSNSFPKPPRRIIELDLDDKLEEEANTSASSGEGSDQIVQADEVKFAISAAADDQAATTKRLMEEMLKFEDLLGTARIAPLDSIREIKKFTRFLIANSLSKKENFSSIPRESIAIAAILLAAEKFELDLAEILAYFAQNFRNKRINKLAKIRELRAYSLLKSVVDSYSFMPSSP